MSDLHSTTPSPQSKPAKPYPEFPLFAHAAGVWAKKIRGKLHYFGPWNNPKGALEKYNREKDDLHAGRRPRQVSAGIDVRNLCNAFWNAKHALILTRELSPRTMQDYQRVTDLIAESFGKSRLVEDLGPDDFAELRGQMAKRWGPVTLGKTIQGVRSVFKFGYESGLIDRPIRFGPGFKRPSARMFRAERAKMGPKLFTAEEIRRMLGYPPWQTAANPVLSAMILLGSNCGLGNTDIALLPLSALDLDAGWIDFPRPKTGIARRCPLWPETVAAIRQVLAGRPEPTSPDDSELVFITRWGARWVKTISDTEGVGTGIDDAISKEMAKLLRKLKLRGRKGAGFYDLRRTFRTIADEAKDQPAADHIMGHEVAHMSAVYRQRISDERLRAVTEHVRSWLFGDSQYRSTQPVGRQDRD
jgi:integrase